MNVGFIGLGQMGAAMAQNLVNAGHQVTVYNRTRAKAEAIKGAARVADSSGDAARGAEAVITMVADDPALREVVFGDAGILRHLVRGAVHVSCSTISVELSKHLAGVHAEQKQHYVAAPVFGRPEAAAAAKLAVIAAGAADQVERCRPLFAAIGDKHFTVGSQPELANVVKLSGNFMIAAAIESMGQALALVRKYGVDGQEWLRIMTETLFPVGVYKGYGDRIVRGEFRPAGFRTVLGLKDVRLALAAAEAAEVPMPLASLIRDDFIAALAAGMRDDDWSSLALVSARRAGLKE